MKNIVIFEDSKHVNLKPLSSTRPVHFLKSGIFSIREKIHNLLGKDRIIYLHQREIFTNEEFLQLKENERVFYPVRFDEEKGQLEKNNTKFDDGFIIINGRVLPNGKLVKVVEDLEKEKIFKVFVDDNKNVVAAYLPSTESFNRIIDLYFSPEVKSVEYLDSVKIINYPWDLVNNISSEIEKDIIFKTNDLDLIGNNELFDSLSNLNITLVNTENIFIDNSAKIKAGVIIDATDGPVILDKNVTIMHNSVIIGPCYIGENSIIKIGSKIYENCSIGKTCKVGGEVEDTIIHAFSNKQHDGFLGHAYLGEWCNLGADTNNSDLKNNYSTVLVEIDSKLVDTGSQFVGLFMGDHSKTGINTMFNTGTVVGTCCNVYGEGFPPRNIPDFHWGGKEKLIKYPLRRIMETNKKVKARRSEKVSEIESKNLENLFNNE